MTLVNHLTTQKEIPLLRDDEVEKTSFSDAERTISAVKRVADQTNAESELESLRKKQARFHSWSSTEANDLWKFVKPADGVCNPFASVKVNVLIGNDSSGKEKYASFQLPQTVLRITAPSFYEKEFNENSTWKENQQGEVFWKGDATFPCIHPEAAGQVILFANTKGGIINRSLYRTLEQLRHEFPNSFNVILNDILRLSHQYDIAKLRKESLQFIQSQIMQNNENVVYYLEWALAASPQINAFELWVCALENGLKKKDNLEFCSILIFLAEADYSNIPQEKAEICKILQKYFKDRILSPIEIKPDEWDKVVHCFRLIYPKFDIPKEVIQAINLKFDKSYFNLFSTEGKLLFYFCHVFGDCFTYGMKADIHRYLNSLSGNEQLIFHEIVSLIRAGAFVNSTPGGYPRIQRMYPNNILAMRKSIEVYKARERFDLAIPIITRLLTLAPDDIILLEERRICYEKMEQAKRAEQDLNTIQQLKAQQTERHK